MLISSDLIEEETVATCPWSSKDESWFDRHETGETQLEGKSIWGERSIDFRQEIKGCPLGS